MPFVNHELNAIIIGTLCTDRFWIKDGIYLPKQPRNTIPPDGRVNRWDMKVSVYRQQDGRRRRTVIGAATSETMMLPNDNFRIKYPDLWNE